MRKKMMLCCGLISLLTVSSCSRKGETQDAEPVKVKTMTMTDASQGMQFPLNGQVYSGTIEEASATSLSFAVPGTVRQIMASEGQRVSKGQLLAVLDETSLRSSHASAKAALTQAEDAYQRMKQLHDNGSLPDIQWVDVESKLQQARSLEEIARKQLADGRLYAPAGGVISKKNVEPGQTVAPGLEVLRLLNVSAVKMTISVPEREIGSIAIGTSATATVDALDARQYAVRVSEKGTTANPLTRSYEVKFSISNADGALRPGMLCSVTLAPTDAMETGNKVLPASAVMLTEKNTHYVWIVTDGKAHRRNVTIGGTATGGVVIATGLTASDTVIVEGMQKVYEGCTVKEIEQL
jgi:RND family efflux transporter MFP subunit